MKQFYHFILIFFICHAAISQRSVQLGVLPPNGGLINMTPNKTITHIPARIKKPKPSNSSVATLTASLISYSDYVPGAINSHNQPLQYNKYLNLLTYYANRSATYPSASNPNKGNIVCYYSTNDGASWDSTLIYSDAGYFASLAGGSVYNPLGNTNITNAWLVGSAPLNNDTNWVGNYYTSKRITSVGTNTLSADAQTKLNKNLPSGPLRKHHFAYTDFTVTEGSYTYVLGEILSDPMATTNSQYGYRGASLVKGLFSAGAFVWSNDSFIPSTKLRADGSKYLHHQAMMAWNNDGSVGYIVFYGVDVTALNENNTFQPLIYKTTNSGASWAKLPKLCFYSYVSAGAAGCMVGGVTLNNMEAVASNTNLIKPFFSMKEGADITVDMNNQLHIFSNIVPAASNHQDSLDYVFSYTPERYSFKNKPNSYATLWDVSTNLWGYGIFKIDSMGTEGASGNLAAPGYTSNVWDDGKGGKLSLNARMQISRTYDGTKLFYSWTETDSTLTGSNWNIYPDIQIKGLDLTTQKLTQRTNVTGGLTNSYEQGYFHYSAPIVKNISASSWRVPMVYSTNSFSTTAGLPISNYYITDIDFSPSQFNVTAQYGSCNAPMDIKEDNKNYSVTIFPNPSDDNIIVNLDGTKFNKNYELAVINALGQEIKRERLTNSQIEINGLNSGMYFVNVYENGTLIVTKKIVIAK